MLHNPTTMSYLLVFFLILLIYYTKFECTGHQPISAANFGWRVNHIKCLILWYLRNVCFKFRLGMLGGGGDCSPAAPLSTPPGCARGLICFCRRRFEMFLLPGRFREPVFCVCVCARVCGPSSLHLTLMTTFSRILETGSSQHIIAHLNNSCREMH
jgi:hypothetical protein